MQARITVQTPHVTGKWDFRSGSVATVHTGTGFVRESMIYKSRTTQNQSRLSLCILLGNHTLRTANCQNSSAQNWQITRLECMNKVNIQLTVLISRAERLLRNTIIWKSGGFVAIKRKF
jgi:hypothetical protein